MDQSSAVWILIALSLITASLPFVVERPFVALPWTQAGEPDRSLAWRWIESLVFFALLVALAYFALQLIGGAFFTGSDMGSVGLFLAKVGGVIAIAALMLAYPGWRNKGQAVKKAFIDRLLEVMVFYALVGTLGFAFEANIGNVFTQNWEFYAITFSLFLVLAYPGFVYRYLMRHPKPKNG